MTTAHIDFYFDPISPYAYLAFEQLPAAFQGIGHSVAYKPVLFGALLKHHGQLGPAEIAPKKEWTFRQVNWLARQAKLPVCAPTQHPFNPLQLLRLLVLAGARAGLPAGQCNRYQAEQVLRHVWAQPHALDAADPVRIAELASDLLQPFGGAATSDAELQASKAALVANANAAIALGVFGVPCMAVGADLFWGLDSLPILRARLQGDAWFDGPAWLQAAPPEGITRPR